MIKILNPGGLEEARRALNQFDSKLRLKLSQTAIVWSTTDGPAVFRKPIQGGVGLLLQLVVDPKSVELRIRKVSKNKLDPDFSDAVLEVSEEIVQRLLTNHH